MLVLSRRRDQAFNIGDNIVIRIIDVRGDKVRIGIEAPKDFAIVRDDTVKLEPAPPACVLPTRGK